MESTTAATPENLPSTGREMNSYLANAEREHYEDNWLCSVEYSELIFGSLNINAMWETRGRSFPVPKKA